MGTHSTTLRRDFLKTAGAAVAAPYVITSTALGNADRRAGQRSHRDGRHRHRQHGLGRPGRVPRPPRRAVRRRVRRAQGRARTRPKDKADKKYGNSDCKAYNDFRELLARTDIDAVHVATPDHWHAIMVIEACRNGKDVYCQKPETRTLREGPLMVEAARRYARVVSGGSQRVLEDYRKIVDQCWGGELGPIKSINVNVGPLSQLCNLPAEADAGRHRLGHVARSRAVGAVQQGALRRQLRHQRRKLAVVYRLLRRRHDRLGRAPLRRRDVRRRCPRAATRGSQVPQRERRQVADVPLSQRHPADAQPSEARRTWQVEGTPGEKREAKPVPSYKGQGGIYGDFIALREDAREAVPRHRAGGEHGRGQPPGHHRLRACSGR